MPVSQPDAYKIRLWKRRLEKNGIQVHGVDVLYSKRTHSGATLFALVNADATTPEGHKLLPLCFIKGEVVCVLVCLIDKETGGKYLLLVRQRRICDGSLSYEHPAGMMDEEQDPFRVAEREIEEETGIRVKREQLVHLNADQPYFPSTGTCDEAMYLMYCELEMPEEEIHALHLKNRGEVSENEVIVTYVAPFAEAYRLITNTNGLLHCYLYLSEVKDWEMMRRLGKAPGAGEV